MQTPAIGEGAGVPYGYPQYPYYNPHFNPYHAVAMPQRPGGDEEEDDGEQQEDRWVLLVEGRRRGPLLEECLGVLRGLGLLLSMGGFELA